MTIQPSRPGIPADILALSHERDELRRKGKYDRADALKRQIEEAGYGIKDNPRGAHLIILPSVEVDGMSFLSISWQIQAPRRRIAALRAFCVSVRAAISRS